MDNIYQVDESNRKPLPTQKGSPKPRIKTLIPKDDYKKQEQDQDFVSSPKLQRTCSVHHLQTDEWVHPIIFFPGNVTESRVSSKTHGDLTNHEVNDSQDILDMFKVDKELFVNTLQDCSLSTDTKPKLTKCGSFPTAYKSVSRNLIPMKLEDKLNEIYIISKAEKAKNSHDDLNGKNIIRLRRVCSLNESADRYTRFLDFSDGKEVTLCTSRSMKLNQGSHDAYFLRSFSQNERNAVSLSLHKDTHAELSSRQDCKALNEVMDKSDTFVENEHSLKANSPTFCDDAYGLKVKEDDHQISGQITQESPVFVSEYRPPEEKVRISEGNLRYTYVRDGKMGCLGGSVIGSTWVINLLYVHVEMG